MIWYALVHCIQQHENNETNADHNAFARNIIHDMMHYCVYEIVKGNFIDIADNFTLRDNNETSRLNMGDDEEKE